MRVQGSALPGLGGAQRHPRRRQKGVQRAMPFGAVQGAQPCRVWAEPSVTPRNPTPPESKFLRGRISEVLKQPFERDIEGGS